MKGLIVTILIWLFTVSGCAVGCAIGYILGQMILQGMIF